MHALYILYAHDSLKVGTISQFVTVLKIGPDRTVRPVQLGTGS